MNDHPLVLIEWEDSTQPVSNWSWLSDHIWNEVCKCQSVGWLIYDDDDVKALAPNIGNMNEDIQISAAIRIPTKAITKITKLVKE